MSGFKKLFKKKSTSAKNALSTEDLSDAGSMASGYSITKDKDLPKLHKAVWTGDLSKVKQLVKKGDINQLDRENRTALHLASAQGKEEILKFLLANNSKTNLCDNYGRTPLMKVVECQFQECAKILLDQGAQANVVDVNNSTSLHLAAANGDVDIAVLLLEREAKVDAQDKEGFTPLHVASSLGNLDFVNFLINEGANVDAVDAHGRTSLMTSASEGHIGIVRLFLQHNANTELKDTQGWKASDHAVIHGHHSVSNIIEEYEEQQEQARNEARAAKSNQSTPSKRQQSPGLMGSGSATNDGDFSFGGPVADEGGYNSTSAREDDSVSHHSAGEDSWDSSGAEDDNMFGSKAKTSSAKPSLLAALNKSSKQVSRAASDVSTQSAKSSSRIPIKATVAKSEPIQEPKPSASEANSQSRIPVRSGETQSPSPAKNLMTGGASPKNSPTNSQHSTPTRRKLPTPGGVGQVVKEPTQTRTEESKPQSRPWELTADHDSEGAISDSDVLAALSGGNIKLPKPTAGLKAPQNDDNLDFSLTSSGGEGNDDEDVSFSEPPLDDEDDEPLTRPSSGFTPTPQPLTSTQKHVPPKLGIDLGSSVSSVSDPDVSGVSDKEPAKQDGQRKATKPAEPIKPDDESQSEDESAWDSSDADILPSDGPDTTRGSSLFDTRSPLPSSRAGDAKAEKPSAVSPRKTGADESDSEATETESEWEKERAAKKAQRQEEEREKEKEKQRIIQWEKEQKEKEEALAKELQAEMELEMEMERKEREEDEKRRKEEQENERRRKQDEEKERKRREDERREKERQEDERKRQEEERRRREKEIEEREKGEELDRQLRQREEERAQLEREQEEEHRKREEELQKLKELQEEEMLSLERKKELELERQMRMKEEEMERQKQEYEERMERERIAMEEQQAMEEEDRLQKQRTVDEEAEQLLHAYRQKQEELLEKERRFEEEMAQRERELEERTRAEPERIPVQEVVTFEQKNQQYSSVPAGDQQRSQVQTELEEWKGMYEMNVEKEKTALEDAVRKRKAEEQKAEEAAVKLRQIQQEEGLTRIEGALRHRRQGEELKETEKKLQRLEAEEQAVNTKKELEQQQVKELEAQRNRLDQETSAKLAELNNRHRRAELEQKSRQIHEERDQLSATFEAARQRTSELNQPPQVSILSPDKRLSVVSLGSDRDHGEKGRNPGVGKNMKDIDKRVGEQPIMNGHVDEGDWSESSDEDRQGRYSPLVAMAMTGTNTKPPIGFSPPRTQSPLIKASTPTPLNATGGALGTSLNGSFALQDSQSFARLQEALRESKRQVDKQRERIIALETSRKQMESDLAELQERVEAVTKEKSESERLKMEVEAAHRTLQYKYDQESEARRVSEALHNQLKEQITRCEEKLAKELENRQNLEVEKRQQQIENKSLRNSQQQLESDVRDLKRALAEEQDAHSVQNELLEGERRKNEVLFEETRNHSLQKTEALYQLEAVDQTRKSYEASSGSLREELRAAQVELADTKARLDANKASMGKEIALLKEKLQKKADKVAKSEEALQQTRAEFDSHVTSGRNEHAQISSKLESETQTRARLESEISSLRSRLEKSDKELEKTSVGRVEAERQAQNLRDELYQAKLRLEKETASLKDANKGLIGKLETAENKASSRDIELQTANVMLTERGSQLSLVHRDTEHQKSQHDRLQEKIRLEKEQNSRLSAKLEGCDLKISSFHSDCDSLRRRLEESNEKLRKQEEASLRSEEKFNAMLSSSRTDFEKSKHIMTEKQETLLETINKLKSDVDKGKEKSAQQKAHIRDLQQELNETSKKLVHSETSLEMQIKLREELEDERSRLRSQLMNLENAVATVEATKGEVTGHALKLEEELEHTKRVQGETTDRLVSRSADVESVTRSLAQLEQMVTRLKVDKATLEASLREEEAKCGLLLKEVKESNEARQSLEKLLSNVKGDSIELENRLQSESLSRTQHEREADEHKELWEAEVRSRTKLGAKIGEMERRLGESRAVIEEEKRKTRKALEMKKVLEAKLEVSDQRTTQHQKEVVALKTQLKSYKRRFKEYESSESRIPALRVEFDKERAAMESHITSLRRQLDNLSERLHQEAENRSRVQLTSKQQQQELSGAKAEEKRLIFEQERLEHTNRQLEEEVGRLKGLLLQYCGTKKPLQNKAFYENNFVEKGQMEAYKQELEAKSRFELNRKLEEVNAHLEEQAVARDKLDKIREANESKTKRQLEMTISDLKAGVSKMRVGFHESQTQKETYDAEAKRYKDLYESELKSKDKLTNRLYKANEKMAESHAMLNLERSRRSFEGLQRGTSPQPFTSDSLGGIYGSPDTSPNRMYSKGDGQLMKAVENELNKSIKRHLESAPVTSDLDLKPSLLSDGDSGSYGPLTASSKQYMSLLRKNYFV